MLIKPAITILILVFLSSNLGAQSIVNTVHNLSVGGPGSVKATTESEVCIFCHTPHNSQPYSPLWNRSYPGFTYILYNSSTAQAAPGQPDGSSILCLSCHDGTIALGNVLSRPATISFGGGVTVMPQGLSNLGTDLANDHPVSFIYNSALATSDGKLVDPVTLNGPVRLENSKMQCTSCHDPHNNTIPDFLVASNEYSALCLACHQDPVWPTSRHQTSNKTWNGSGTDPWPYTNFTTVAQNACENCHQPHNGTGKIRLMKYAVEENNCLDCHNGNTATKNIQAQFTKTYRHNVYNYLQVHDPNEAAISTVMHVECSDCHNAHAVKGNAASAPFVKGSNIGVKGVDQGGNVVNGVQYEYEICYRCHADSPNKPPSMTTRQIAQNNTRLEFASTNPSFHAVAGTGVNNDVPSLIAPLTVTSRIYCTDCHASDGSGSPAGPHGSQFPGLLKFKYVTADNTNESAANYALCYSCHSRNSILNDISFERHHTHISDEDTPCNICHDPHGISSTQGNSINNSNLINFNTSVVSPFNGILKFEDLGNRTGRCYLVCHGEAHDPYTY